MHKFILAVCVAFLFASSRCWDATSRQEILDAIVVAIDGTDISKATDAYKSAINSNSVTLEVYDNFLSYNSDYIDRVGEDASEDAFAAAETNIQVPQTNTMLPSATYDPTSGIALVKFYYVGNYCYSFNPCVSMKLGFHTKVTFPEGESRPTPEQWDGDAFSQSFAAIKIPQLKAVVKAKLDANKSA
jgi:hypothetical protein